MPSFFVVQLLSTSGFPVHHQFPELAQTRVHQVGDAIQPSPPLSPTSPPTLNHSQHQGLSSESPLRIWWTKHWSFSFSTVHQVNIQGGFL